MIKTISIRIPEELIKQVEKIAKDTERTKSKTYEILILKGIKSHKS